MRRQARRPPRPVEVAQGGTILAVSRLGEAGDGIGHLPDGQAVHVMGVLPGEVVRLGALTRRGEGLSGASEALLEASLLRVPPPCPRFGLCGGCTVQHIEDQAYAAWKLGLVQAALARIGAPEVPLGPLRRTPPGDRRRADFAVQRAGRRVEVGFNAARSAVVVPIGPCPVLDPRLMSLAPALAAALGPLGLPQRTGSAQANLTETDIDLLLRTDAPLDLAAREALAAFAHAADLARLSWAEGDDQAEPIAVRRRPLVTFGGIAVEPPPGAFLQASRAGEAAIVTAVLDGLGTLPDGARVLDLFAGLGTLSFPLAARFRVRAFEGDPDAAEAARAAARTARLGERVQVETRDLARRPPDPRDLAAAAALVLDPPRGGAPEVAAAIAAASAPGRVVYVACALPALVRDARILLAAGYRLVSVAAIDQFLWTPHVEVVACFER